MSDSTSALVVEREAVPMDIAPTIMATVDPQMATAAMGNSAAVTMEARVTDRVDRDWKSLCTF
jgi:hypothetical protein